ncbi:MAG: C40 family peptidase [Tahibacter sp.]
MGTPYHRGGNTPQGGFDCSGLVAYVYKDAVGLDLPHNAEDMSRLDALSVSRDRLEAGDLVFFRHRGHIGHVGIYVGKGRFIHAPNEGGTVRLDLLDGDWWREHYDSARRLLH